MDTYERERVTQGTDAPLAGARVAGADSLLAGVRRLTRLADSAREPQEVFRALAGELFVELACDEVQVHRLCEDEDEVDVCKL